MWSGVHVQRGKHSLRGGYNWTHPSCPLAEKPCWIRQEEAGVSANQWPLEERAQNSSYVRFGKFIYLSLTFMFRKKEEWWRCSSRSPRSRFRESQESNMRSNRSSRDLNLTHPLHPRASLNLRRPLDSVELERHLKRSSLLSLRNTMSRCRVKPRNDHLCELKSL